MGEHENENKARTFLGEFPADAVRDRAKFGRMQAGSLKSDHNWPK